MEEFEKLITLLQQLESIRYYLRKEGGDSPVIGKAHSDLTQVKIELREYITERLEKI